MIIPIEYDHPCTVDVSLHATISEEVTEDITEFSLDLVSPVEYLFKKFSAKEFGRLLCSEFVKNGYIFQPLCKG